MANYKKFIALLLIFSVSFHSAFATTLGGWTITDTIRQGASTIVNATKTVVINGSNVAKTSTAVIAPTASQVAKMIVRTGAVLAVDLAIKSLIGAVDYVMDPANNEVVYQIQGECTPELCTTTQKIFIVNGFDGTQYQFAENDADGACRLAVRLLYNQENKPKGWQYSSYRYVSGSNKQSVDCLASSISAGYTDYPLHRIPLSINTNYDPTTSVEEKRISYETVAQQIIDTAETGDTKAGGYVGEVADDLLANDAATQSDVQQQLEANAKTEIEEGAGEATGSTKPVDPANPDLGNELSLEFPVFCTWAPSICEAAQTVISFPQTLINWWDSATTSISESWTWAKSRYEAAVTSISEFFSEETNTDTELEFNDPTDDITDTTISFSDQCPAPITLADFNYHGIQQKWEMDFTGWCDVLTTYFKPIVIAMAGFSAVLIVSGVRENG